jgi:hypothetical protein
MANRKYKLALGQKPGAVVESAGTTISAGAGIEVNIDYGAEMSRGELRRHLVKMERSLLTCPWPPAA